MKTLAEIQKILQEQKPFLTDRYGIRIVGVFGSYVRQEQRPDSDLDLLIDLDRPPRISLSRDDLPAPLGPIRPIFWSC